MTATNTANEQHGYKVIVLEEGEAAPQGYVIEKVVATDRRKTPTEYTVIVRPVDARDIPIFPYVPSNPSPPVNPPYGPQPHPWTQTWCGVGGGGSTRATDPHTQVWNIVI